LAGFLKRVKLKSPFNQEQAGAGEPRKNMHPVASYIEHTLLKPDATAADIEKLCAEARQWEFYGVCVNGTWVRHTSLCLQDSSARVVSVAGFPLGAASTAAKRFETETAIADGAQEVDVVLNIGRLKQRDDSYILKELAGIVQSAAGHTVKVIIETCLLSEEEKIRACRLTIDSGAHFVKTSTGFSSGGATIEDISLLRKTVGPEFGVKASGGIRNAGTALAMITAGANRIGTSAGLTIIRGLAKE
jgi:deoxyribose-phosphate aldolase